LHTISHMLAKRYVFAKKPARRAEAGFTLPEVLLAAFIISVAFVTLLSVIPYSTASVQSGSQTSTATFLADQKLEEAKHVPWTSTPDNDCLGYSNGNNAPTVSPGKTCTLGGVVANPGQPLPWAVDQNATAIPNFSGYARTVRITDCTAVGSCFTGIGDSGMRLVVVSVTYTPGVSVNSTAASAKTVRVSMLVAQR
jgi:prepilin-type N-terminal cleavage/methylation domain-containing protein